MLQNYAVSGVETDYLCNESFNKILIYRTNIDTFAIVFEDSFLRDLR